MHSSHYVSLDLSKEKWKEMRFGDLLNILQETKTIKRLKLCNLEKISDEFIEELKKALKKNHTLKQIDFSGNKFDYWQVKQIISGLLGNDTVKHLNFSNSVFPNLPKTPLFEGDPLNAFSDLLFCLTKMNTIVTFNLNFVSLDYYMINALCSFLENTTSLEILCLSRCNITSEDAEKVAEALAKNKTLRKLDLSSNSIDQAAVEKILEALSKNNIVTDLNLAFNWAGPDVTDKMMEALKTNTALTRLNMSNNGFKLKDFKRIANGLMNNNTLLELTYVLIIYLKFVFDAEFVTLLFQNKNLTNLKLFGHGFGDEALSELARCLRHNTTIRELHLSISSNVTVLHEIGKALQGNNTLTIFKMTVSNYDWKDFPDDLKQVTIKQIIPGLRTCTALTVLHLTEYNCGPEDAELVAEFLKHNRTLTDLEFYGNEIGDQGTEYIASALAVNKSLINLNLNSNEIDCRGFEMLAEALKQNRKLEKLDIYDNDVAEEGVKRLAEALKYNCHLYYLSFSLDYLSPEAQNQLIAAFRHNKTIRVLPEFVKAQFKDLYLELNMYLERNSNLLQKVISIANYVYINRTEEELILRDISKQDFEEFQELQVTRQMIIELKTILEVSFAEAENMITFTQNFIRNHFFEIAGIQDSPLVQFPLLLQNKILSYLKLKDINN